MSRPRMPPEAKILGLLAKEARREHASPHAYARAKAAALRSALVAREVCARLQNGELPGEVSCLEPPDGNGHEGTRVRLRFRRPTADGPSGTLDMIVRGGRVEKTPHSSHLGPSWREVHIAPLGDVPFVLRVPSAVPSLVSDPASVEQRRLVEYDYFHARGLAPAPAYLPAGWLGPAPFRLESVSPSRPSVPLRRPVASRRRAARSVVVLLADDDDISARVVAREVELLGGRALILDPRAYPERWQLTVSLGAAPRTSFLIREPAGASVHSDEVAGIWCRARAAPRPESVVSPSAFAFAQRESLETLNGWLDLCGDRVMNPRAAELRAENKLVQLAHAAVAALTVLPTAATNDPEEAARLLDARPTVVFKTFTSMPGRPIETRRLDESHRGVLDTLRHGPALFQTEVAPKTDVRVIVVDDELFAMTIEPRTAAARLDHRLDSSTVKRPLGVPVRIAAAIRAFMRSVHLRYGALDFAIDERGRYVFLEVNTRGVFLPMEIHCGQPVSGAIAASLLRSGDMPRTQRKR